MTLVDALRRRLGEDAGSFQLAGEGLAALAGADLVGAAQDYEARLADAVPASLHRDFLAAQAAHAEEAYAWLARHNRSLGARVRGYLALGERTAWAYPWPVVAILGLNEVRSGIGRTRVWGLVGGLAARLGVRALAAVADLSEDVLRRTNRAIFADSVPTVLYALRCLGLRQRGEAALCDALLAGPLPPAMDEVCRELMRALVELLARPASSARFAELAALTLRHFDREQSIFTHHLGRAGSTRAPTWLGRLMSARSIEAPAIARAEGRRALVFRRVALPTGFELRDHAARVRVFGAAYVQSVTGDEDDYLAARDWVRARFGG